MARQRRHALTLLALVTLVFLLAVSSAFAAPVPTTRVNVSSGGAQAGDASVWASISANGRYVGFYSYATNLVPGDTNGALDVFVRDTVTNTLQRVSVSSTGVQSNGPSSDPFVSADGRYVAFQSQASNLVPGDTNAAPDVFVRDTVLNTTTRVSIDSAGGQADSYSGDPVITADGRYVAFESGASNLVSGDTNANQDIFVRDTLLNKTVRVSVSSAGAEGVGGESDYASISADGRYVSFDSQATNLVPGDTNAAPDAFVRDTVSNTTTRVSVSTVGGQGNGESSWPSLSADGRKVLFFSVAANLVPGDSNAFADTFVRDMDANTTTRVSVDSAGVQGNGACEPRAAISADGTDVAFTSAAKNLVPGDTNGVLDVFVRDMVSNKTTRASVDSAGTQGNGDCDPHLSLSADGGVVAFASAATNLVPGDTNAENDIFTRVLHSNIIATSGPNGTVTPAGTSVVPGGANLTYTIKPDKYYHVDRVLVDGMNFGPLGSYTFVSVAASHSIEASFAVDTHMLTYTAGPGGTIVGTSPQLVNGGGSGTEVVATPNPGYHFVGWSDLFLSANRTDANVVASKTVSAIFAINTYTLNYAAGAGGTISGTTPQSVAHGSSGTQVTAVANSGFRFANWSDGNTNAVRTETNVTLSRNLTANFEDALPIMVSVTGVSPTRVDVVFSESVQGVSPAGVGFSIVGLNVAGASASGNTVQLTTSAHASQPYTVNVAAGAVTDSTGNPNPAGSAGFTGQAPPVTSTPASSTWSLALLALLGACAVVASGRVRGSRASS